MRLILLALTATCLLATPLRASCDGQDLRETLTAGEMTLLDARLAETPYPEGNHWRATRKDEVLHLIGTLHLSDQRLDAPVAHLTPVVAGAGRLLLEMTQTEEAELEQALATRADMLLLPDTTLPELLPEADWQLLSEALRLRGMPPFMAAKMRPWYVSMLLAVPPCMADQMQEQTGLDKRLAGIARENGVPTRALEPFDTAFTAFADMPLDTQILMIRSALASPETNEDLFETLLSAYFAETHGAGQIILEVLSPRLTTLSDAENARIFTAMDDALLKRRNRAWIPVILDALEETEGHVVAGFGAAHLAGENGVLALLEAEGFTLQRLSFSEF